MKATNDKFPVELRRFTAEDVAEYRRVVREIQKDVIRQYAEKHRLTSSKAMPGASDR